MSKILKQNGANGKIMRAQTSGKVLKQNYNFGKKYVGINKIVFNYSNIGKVLTQEIWIDYDNYSTGGFLYETIINGNYYRGTQFYTKRLFHSINGGSDDQFLNEYNSGRNYLNIHFDTTLGIAKATTVSGYNNITFQESDVDSDITYSYIMGAYHGVSLLRFYNRELTPIERIFNENNKLGNEPLNKFGLQGEYNFNSAEILDFSAAQDGSDLRVGIADTTGSLNHGEITELPAGTLQEQLNYANANLFEIW